MEKHNLSDPITLRLPKDVLAEIEEIAGVCERTRSWVIVRALKTYLAGEGKDILEIAQARRDIENGLGEDFDDVMADLDAMIKGAAA